MRAARPLWCFSRHTPVMRYLELLLPDPDFAVTPPLRILGIVAAPADLPPLDVAKEKAGLEKALRQPLDAGQVELAWLERATWKALQDALQQGPWHILHFTGHATFDNRIGEGAVVMTDDAGADVAGERNAAGPPARHSAYCCGWRCSTPAKAAW